MTDKSTFIGTTHMKRFENVSVYYMLDFIVTGLHYRF